MAILLKPSSNKNVCSSCSSFCTSRKCLLLFLFNDVRRMSIERSLTVSYDLERACVLACITSVKQLHSYNHTKEHSPPWAAQDFPPWTGTGLCHDWSWGASWWSSGHSSPWCTEEWPEGNQGTQHLSPWWWRCKPYFGVLKNDIRKGIKWRG